LPPKARAKAQPLHRSGRAKARRKATRILAAAERLETLAERSEKVVEQIGKRLAGEPIRNRLVSLFDPDARPIRKRTHRAPTEFGFVEQRAEVSPNTNRGTRGFILAPTSAPGNPGENELLPDTVAELQRLGLSPREVALDGGFQTKASEEALAPLAPERIYIAGRASPGSKRTQRRLARYRTGAEGRISHLKRRHRLRRSRLKGREGERTWSGWAVFASNAEAYGRYARAEHEDLEPRQKHKAKPVPQLLPPPTRPRPAAGVYPGEVARSRRRPRPARRAWTIRAPDSR
jgi:IS5 family transposase